MNCKDSLKNKDTNKNPDDFQSTANCPGFCVCMTIVCHDGNKQKQLGGKFDWELGALL